ncbi:MAG TPA: prepilin-type N-terminal cleavage/methylation domain-containing protein [Candidatus Saccharimonas sp.]|mgnify:CR=1 FL=1|nr:prepilin-type N-terminal cleavage/methylation domain-containing protein [Candidatus Saccharibacteria bacterium]MCA9336462.1 prepilin-type N-terminal cleavage/methylation domain-containing protein [Candidatus Saccharibacteria bacterium]HPQ82174.1 prepilin-type N-terminal cleavage/methylation domain-containing protein [Candidatus Saccharimonas sp.]
MRQMRGFTVVELVVVMVIMAILLTLGMVGISDYQVAARNKERQADAEAIARGLERRYTQGNKVITSAGNYGPGGYPNMFEFIHMSAFWDLSGNGVVPGFVSGGYLVDNLPGTTKSSFSTPGNDPNNSLIYYCFFCGVGPENATYLATYVTKDKYVYEPLTATGGQCNSEVCTRFNLYYRKEGETTYQTIRSIHQ